MTADGRSDGCNGGCGPLAARRVHRNAAEVGTCVPGTDRSTGELSPRLGLQPPAASRQGEGKLQTRLGRQSTDATATGGKILSSGWTQTK